MVHPRPAEADTLGLNLNESPIGPSPRAIEAAMATIAGVNRYPPTDGGSLVAALAAHTGIPADRIGVSVGSDMMLHLLCMVSLAPGRSAVLPFPSFPRYGISTRISGARAIPVEVTPDGSNDPERLLASVADDTSIVFCCTPNGNTGGILTKDALRHIARHVPDHVMLVVDEAYAEFDTQADTLAILAERKGPWVVTRTFSKAYALAGLRVGYALCSDAAVAEVLRAARPIFEMTSPSLAAAEAALQDKDHLRMMLDLIAAGRTQLTTGLQSLGFSPLPSAANFVTNDLHRPARPILAAMERQGVLVRGVMDPGYENFLRITMAEPLATTLARFAANLRFEDLPEEVVADARLRILDTLGVIMAATHSPTAAAIRRAARALGTGHTAQIVGSTNTTTPSLAALVNGTVAHALDFDDTHNASVMHPSVVSVPAALAMVQALGGTGADLILAVAIGNEIGCRLGLAAPGAFHAAGLHPTSVLGTPAAALIAGRLLGLSEAQLVHAAGITASQGSGVLEAYSDGTWSKTLHPGWAAHAGIVAATLAQEGFTGPESGLDGAYGLFRTHVQSPGYAFDFDATTRDLGTQWHMLETAYKLYPCAHSIHAFAEAALALRQTHQLDATQIVSVALDIPEGFIGQIAEPIDAKMAPRTPTHARASVFYAAASAWTITPTRPSSGPKSWPWPAA
eukprot:gene4283-4333_t